MLSNTESIEIKLMHLEKAHADLNDAYIAQQKQIEILERKIEQLQQQIQQVNESSSLEIIDEPPPHY